MICISERLRLIESLVPQGARVCDVGTDHGYLPAALSISGRAVSVIATDLREKPLETAKKNLERFGVTGVQTRLCDGLSGVDRAEYDTVVIAGMGGEVIAGIMARAGVFDPSVLWILQPTTSAECLREFLWEKGFSVLREPTVAENGKVYSVMQVRYDGQKRDLDILTYYIGIIRPMSQSDVLYIKKQYERCKKCVEALKIRDDHLLELQRYRRAAESMNGLLMEKGEKTDAL